jgi:hypothetical protein
MRQRRSVPSTVSWRCSPTKTNASPRRRACTVGPGRPERPSGRDAHGSRPRPPGCWRSSGYCSSSSRAIGCRPGSIPCPGTRW